jgi:hypothetical protein
MVIGNWSLQIANCKLRIAARSAFFMSLCLLIFITYLADAQTADKPADHNNKNLVQGDFQHGKDGVPDGWDRVAGQRRERLGGQVRWAAEQGNAANRLIRFTLDKQLAENEGVLYYSDYFPVVANAKYRFKCRWRSDGPAVKVFVKCYAEVPDSGRREVYRSQQNLKGPADKWNVHEEEFTPKHSKHYPRWGRVMLYAYLKPGTVEFDDVEVRLVAPPPREADKEAIR